MLYKTISKFVLWCCSNFRIGPEPAPMPAPLDSQPGGGRYQLIHAGSAGDRLQAWAGKLNVRCLPASFNDQRRVSARHARAHRAHRLAASRLATACRTRVHPAAVSGSWARVPGREAAHRDAWGAVLAPGRGRPLRGRRQQASADARKRRPAARASRQCGKGRAGLELDFVAVGLARRSRRRGSRMLVERQQRVVPDAGGGSRPGRHAPEGPHRPAVGAAPAAATTTR